MNMRLDTREVQIAITEYLRKRGLVVDDPGQVSLEIINHRGERLDIAGCAAVVVADNVKFPEEGPYR